MTELGIEAYPLSWPPGWKRTRWRKRSDFRVPTFAMTRDQVLHEIKLLGGRHVVLSSDIPLRLDGLPYAARAEPNDPGVAVYFEYDKKPMCFASDRWDRVRDNVRGIQKTIEAIRGIERWGASDMMERAFTGFLQLPAPGAKPWREVLGFGPTETIGLSSVEQRFRELSRIHHPDRSTGNTQRFQELTAARAAAREAL